MKLTKSFIKKLAERICWSMNMKPEQTLQVRGGVHEQELVEAIAIEASKNGVHAHFSTVSDDYTTSVYKDVPVKYLKKTSKLSMKMVEALDNIISIERPKDPKIMEGISHDKIAASIEGGRPVSKKMDKYGIKWSYVGFPTRELANNLGVNFKLLCDIIFKGMLIDKNYIAKKSTFIHHTVKKSKFVHVWDEFGTDITFKVKGRRINVDDGFISDKDILHGDVGNNLPAGEVYTAPVETYGTGVWVSPKRRDAYTGKMIEDIRMVFEKGQMVMNKSTASKNEKAMKETIKKSMAIDRKNERVIRTTNIAELGIGMNPKVTDIIGYLLTDEKIGGTCHLAIGKNDTYGGTSKSSLHWDFITNKGVNAEAINERGGSTRLIENGKILSG